MSDRVKKSEPSWLGALGLVLSSIDFVCWLATMGPIWSISKALQATPKVITMGEKADGPRRRLTSEKELMGRPFPEVATMFDIMKRSAVVFGDRPALGTRQYLGEGTPDAAKGQRFPPKVFGETAWINYKDSFERMKAFGRGLKQLGVASQPDPTSVSDPNTLEGNYVIVIYENTCADWMVALNGAWSQSVIVSTVYATLGADAVKEAINEGKSPILLCNRASIPMLAKVANQMPTLKAIIYTDDYVKPEDRLVRPQPIPNVQILSVDEVVSLGIGKDSQFPVVPPNPDSMAVIMYTSGTMGKPKGVLIRHKQLLGTVTSFDFHFGKHINKGQEVYAVFLPLAHILEMAAEFTQLLWGSAMGFCCPRTLTAAGAEPRGALEEFRPTILVAVPKIYDLIKKGAEAKAAAGGAVKNFIFKYALASKKAARQRGILTTPLFDTLVFAAVKKITGGRVRFAISGGGPLDPEVQEFVASAITPMTQGYGLTETCGSATIQHHGDLRCGIAGVPNAGNEIRLVDAMAEDGSGPLCDANGVPYRPSDTVNAKGKPCRGRGEVLIGGISVTTGYYKMPEQTRAVYRDGFFETGDIGEFTPDGALMIVDRKKNLVKLKGGEYVALELLETKFSNSTFVDTLAGGILVYAGGDVDRSVAFVQAARKPLENWAKDNGLADTPYEQLLTHPKARKAVLDDLNRCGKQAGLGDLEKLQNVTLLNGGAPPVAPGPDCWTPANGALSATNKLNRRNAMKLLGEARLEKGKVDARSDWLK